VVKSLHPSNNFLRTSSSCIKYSFRNVAVSWQYPLSVCCLKVVTSHLYCCNIDKLISVRMNVDVVAVTEGFALQLLVVCCDFMISTHGCVASRRVPFCFLAMTITFFDCYACSCALFCNARRRLPWLWLGEFVTVLLVFKLFRP
jgi:hypothetical protein